MTGFSKELAVQVFEAVTTDLVQVDAMGRTRTYKSAASRLASRLRVTETGCHEFTGFRNQHGYGQIGVRGRLMATHRVAWIATYGDIADGLCVLHQCDNPPCCNPDHLFLGTKMDNTLDMLAKGRHRAPSNEGSGVVKLSRRDVSDIRAARAAGEMHTTIAERYGVDPAHICRICKGKRRQNA